MKTSNLSGLSLGPQTPITETSNKWSHMREDPTWIWHEWRVDLCLPHHELAANDPRRARKK